MFFKQEQEGNCRSFFALQALYSHSTTDPYHIDSAMLKQFDAHCGACVGRYWM